MHLTHVIKITYKGQVVHSLSVLKANLAFWGFGILYSQYPVIRAEYV